MALHFPRPNQPNMLIVLYVQGLLAASIEAIMKSLLNASKEMVYMR